jgi:hypothetical protein
MVREFNDTPRQPGDWGYFVAWSIPETIAGDCRLNAIFTVMRKTPASSSITMTSVFVYEPRILPHVK